MHAYAYICLLFYSPVCVVVVSFAAVIVFADKSTLPALIPKVVSFGVIVNTFLAVSAVASALSPRFLFIFLHNQIQKL